MTSVPTAIPQAFLDAATEAEESPRKLDFSGVVHEWIYVMIPVSKYDVTDVVFCAFCKACGNYFTEQVPYDTENWTITQAHLPRTGCTRVRSG